jgi:hypothetical protein
LTKSASSVVTNRLRLDGAIDSIRLWTGRECRDATLLPRRDFFACLARGAASARSSCPDGVCLGRFCVGRTGDIVSAAWERTGIGRTSAALPAPGRATSSKKVRTPDYSVAGANANDKRSRKCAGNRPFPGVREHCSEGRNLCGDRAANSGRTTAIGPEPFMHEAGVASRTAGTTRTGDPASATTRWFDGAPAKPRPDRRPAPAASAQTAFRQHTRTRPPCALHPGVTPTRRS